MGQLVKALNNGSGAPIGSQSGPLFFAIGIVGCNILERYVDDWFKIAAQTHPFVSERPLFVVKSHSKLSSPYHISTAYPNNSITPSMFISQTIDIEDIMEDIISMQIQNASPFPFPHVSTCFHTTSQTGEASTESRREAPSRARREGPAARGAHGSRSARGSGGSCGACHGSATGGDAWQMMVPSGKLT